jgi:NAD(P)H dehydrogenase (quinone)
MKIGVSGACGQLGSAIVAELAKQCEHQIVGISRTPQNVCGADVVRFADYDRPESLPAAYADLDRLLIIPTSDLRRGYREVQTLTAIDAAVDVNVGHISLLSLAGTREARMPEVWSSHYVAEQWLIRTSSEWSILRANCYAEAFWLEVQALFAEGVIRGLSESRVAFVSREDVARAAAGLLLGNGHAGAIYNATGPVSLSGVERTEIVHAVTGRPFQYDVVPENRFRAILAGMGLSPAFIESMVSVQSCFARGGFDIVTGDVLQLTGRQPLALETALCRVSGFADCGMHEAWAPSRFRRTPDAVPDAAVCRPGNGRVTV